MRNILLAFAGVAALSAPFVTTTAHAQGLFNCNKPNNSSGSGAIIGGLLGGVLGNGLAGDDHRDRIAGTVIGAGVGAAVGSSVGCNMGSADTTRAETATRQALDENRSTTWSNNRTDMSGRIDIINTFYRDDVSARAPDYAGPPRSLDNVRLARGVSLPADYDMLGDRYAAHWTASLYAAPDPHSAVLGEIREGEGFDALAKVSGGWLLAGQNGVAIGYVIDSWADYQGRGDLMAYGPPPPPSEPAVDRQVCRTFDQTVRHGSQRAQTERLTACQTPGGDWVLQS